MLGGWQEGGRGLLVSRRAGAAVSPGRGRLCRRGRATRWQAWPGCRTPFTGALPPCKAPPASLQARPQKWVQQGIQGRMGAAPRTRCEQLEPGAEVAVPGWGGEWAQGWVSGCSISSLAPQRKPGGLKQPESASSLPWFPPQDDGGGRRAWLHCGGDPCALRQPPPPPCVSRLLMQQSALLLWAVKGGVVSQQVGSMGR